MSKSQPDPNRLAAAIAVAVGASGAVYAANNSVQGAKKDDHAFDGDAPTAILMEATSGSILFEKNADELRASDDQYLKAFLS